MVKYYDPLSDAEKNNKTNFFLSGAAGILSGLIKVPEGVFSLAAELFDLGADTDTAASVEEFFDNKVFNAVEDVARERAIGKLTEAFTQIGIPGAVGFKLGQKLATKALQSKKAGTLLNLKNPNLQKSLKKTAELNDKAGYKRFAAGVMGGAAGETFVADIERIGTFGDMIGGPTKLDREPSDTNRGEALRKLLNRTRLHQKVLYLHPLCMV